MTIAANPPIPGKVLDPPPTEVPDLIQDIDDADHAIAATVGVGYRALSRFNYARSTLLAAGTTYYAFLAMFSLIALAYGVSAMLGTDRLSGYLTEALNEAFPGLLGDEGIDSSQLRAIGQTTSLVGLVFMLYAGGGAMVAASGSIHLIYGAPPNPQNYVLKRLILLGWLLVIVPLIGISFVVGSMLQRLMPTVLDQLGIESSSGRFLVNVLAVALTLAASFLLMYLMLGRLGGIRPPTKALLIGSATGAVIIQLLNLPMAWVLELSLDKPQYAAIAAPIGILLVIYLNCLTVYASAAFTAGFAERDVPIDEIVPVVEIEEAQLKPAGDSDGADS